MVHPLDVWHAVATIALLPTFVAGGHTSFIDYLKPSHGALAVLLLAATMACRAVEERPPFVDRLISGMQSSPVANPPASVWRYQYRGQSVFYVPPSCCDVPGELYNSQGQLLCSPDGGLDGRGDGRCLDFFERRSDGRRIWADMRE